jgi:hypothetical protein
MTVTACSVRIQRISGLQATLPGSRWTWHDRALTGQSPSPSPATPEYAIKTWRYLRLAMIALVIGLATAVVYEIARRGGDCVQTSISAYYYTHAQAVFVVGLAAFVFLAGLAVWDWAHKATPRRPGTVALVGYVVALALWAGGGVVFLAARGWFVGHAHIWSAVAMFTCIIAVAVVNAFSFKRKQGDPDARNRYLVIGVLMPVIVLGLFAFGGKYNVLEAEAAAIFLFAIFWAIQTQELWYEGVRPNQGLTP